MGERDPERSDMVSHSIASTRPVDRMVKVVVVVGGCGELRVSLWVACEVLLVRSKVGLRKR